MLLVKTYLDKSSIHGMGLFASEFIKKGTFIWTLQIGFDVLITKEQFLELPKLTQDYVMHYSYFDETLDCHIICGDNARFFNKSETPNCVGENGDLNGNTIAGQDINEGEELTEIYFNFDELNSIK